MNRSREEMILLDEKIARIRKKNEEILKRKKLIDEEIKQQNALINTKKIDNDENHFGPTLYSDALDEGIKCKKFPINDVVYPNNDQGREVTTERNSNKDEATWRAERKQIDYERIRRQKADKGWMREWDADKVVSQDEFNNQKDWSHNYKEEKNQNENQNFTQFRRHVSKNSREENWNPNLQNKNKKELQSNCFQLPSLKDQKSEDKSYDIRRSYEFRDETERSKNVCTTKAKITTERNYNSPSMKSYPKNDKRISSECYFGTNNASVPKKVSWESDQNSNNETKFNLKDVQNIIINLKNDNSAKRMIKITDERKLLSNLIKGNINFDETTSKNIKDSVAKTADAGSLPANIFVSNKSNPKKMCNAVTETIDKSNSNRSSSVATKHKIIPSYNSFRYNLALNSQDSMNSEKQTHEINLNRLSAKINMNKVKITVENENDDEWEATSDDEWEDVSEEEC